MYNLLTIENEIFDLNGNFYLSKTNDNYVKKLTLEETAKLISDKIITAIRKNILEERSKFSESQKKIDNNL
jgi:hypothetical protein